jgi:hypothetical protein
MKILFENSVSHLTLNVQDENPSACISSVTCDDNTLISITQGSELHTYDINVNNLPVGINSQLVKFTYTLHDTNNNTTNSYEYFLVEKKMISGEAGLSSNGFGDITHEDLIYYDILSSVPFNNVYYDIFDKDLSLDIVNGAVYDHENTMYSGNLGNYIQKKILEGIAVRNHFLIHIQGETQSLYSVSYSVDGGISWINIPTDQLDQVIEYSSGFTKLDIKISWLGP